MSTGTYYRLLGQASTDGAREAWVDCFLESVEQTASGEAARLISLVAPREIVPLDIPELEALAAGTDVVVPVRTTRTRSTGTCHCR